MAGRDLGFTRYDKIAEVLGCHGEHVEKPDEIRPSLERARARCMRKTGCGQCGHRPPCPLSDRALQYLPARLALFPCFSS